MDFPDVNILINAFRPDSTHHEICRNWLNRVFDERRPLAISHQTLASVIRIVTNQRIIKPVNSLEETIGFCDDILNYAHCELIEPGRNHWRIFTALIKETNTTGPTVTDAWLAALAMEWNCELVTMDRDFARFPGLTWSMPKISS